MRRGEMSANPEWRKLAVANQLAANALLRSGFMDRHLPAASRNYYALYQAIIAELQQSPADYAALWVDSKEDKTRKIPHKQLQANVMRLRSRGYSQRDAELIKETLTALSESRVCADYGTEPLKQGDVESEHEELKTVLQLLRVIA